MEESDDRALRDKIEALQAELKSTEVELKRVRRELEDQRGFTDKAAQAQLKNLQKELEEQRELTDRARKREAAAERELQAVQADLTWTKSFVRTLTERFAPTQEERDRLTEELLAEQYERAEQSKKRSNDGQG